MRVARAFRLPIIAVMTALALSGCMRTRAPVAVVAPPAGLDAMAYGQPYGPAPPVVVADSGGGGAIAALRSGFTRLRRASARSGGLCGRAGSMRQLRRQLLRRCNGCTDAGGCADASGGADAGGRTDADCRANASDRAMPGPMTPPIASTAGDRLRVVVYGQEGLTNIYAIDAGGCISMPLIGIVPARGLTPADLAADITGRLRRGYIREPSVAVEIEAYRPFFILGEVAAPGLYPYVPNMSVESAIAIAGGFSPRARRDRVTLTHTDGRERCRPSCRSARR